MIMKGDKHQEGREQGLDGEERQGVRAVQGVLPAQWEAGYGLQEGC